MVSGKVPVATGENLTTTVQEAAAAREPPPEQVPPVPGKLPPFQLKGAAKPPASTIFVAEMSPLLVRVNV